MELRVFRLFVCVCGVCVWCVIVSANRLDIFVDCFRSTGLIGVDWVRCGYCSHAAHRLMPQLNCRKNVSWISFLIH